MNCPVVLANSLDPAEGPGLIFVTLPIAFGNMAGGLLLAVFVGWRVSPESVAEELNIRSPLLLKALRWLVLVSIAGIFVLNL